MNEWQGCLFDHLPLPPTWLNVLEQGTRPWIAPDGQASAWCDRVCMGEWEALYCKAALSHSGWKVQYKCCPFTIYDVMEVVLIMLF